MAVFDYRPETFRLRNSYLLISGLLFSIAFVSNTFLGFLKINSEASDTSDELSKIAGILFLIGIYKATYYFFRLKQDKNQAHRLYFSSREKELDGKMSIDMAMTTDISHDPDTFNAIEEMSEKISYINSTLEQLTNLPLDSIEDAKKTSVVGRQPSDILSQAKGYMAGLEKRYKKFEKFYKSETFLEKFMRVVFMWGVPYLTYLISVIVAWPFVLKGLQLLAFFTYNNSVGLL